MKFDFLSFIRMIVCTLSLIFFLPLAYGQIVLEKLKAFPTAQGGGAVSQGGRSGDTIFVSRREDDDNEGSLRWAFTRAKPRTVVFLVGGEFRLESELIISDESRGYLTVAGETARDIGGLHITGHRVRFQHTKDIILRYIDIKSGPAFMNDKVIIDDEKTPNAKITINGKPYTIDTDSNDIRKVKIDQIEYIINGNNLVANVDALTVFNTVNFIADHCTVGWAGDESASATGYREEDVTFQEAGHNTFQRCMFLEGVKGGSTGSLMGLNPTKDDQITFDRARNYDQHHNIYIHLSHRFFNAVGGKPGIFKNINNVVYGWIPRLFVLFGSARHDIINNYYRQSPASLKVLIKENDINLAKKRLFKFSFEAGEDIEFAGKRRTLRDINDIVPDIYIAGNIIERIEPNPNADNWPYVTLFGSSIRGNDSSLLNIDYQRKEPAPPNEHPIAITSAHTALCDVLNNVGANVRLGNNAKGRYVDSIDKSYLNDIINKEGPEELGSTEKWIFPEYKNESINRSLLDEDGVPIGWEPPPNIINSAGYQKRELYFSQMAGDFHSLNAIAKSDFESCLKNE